MAEESKELMIVSRVKSPPYDHKREVLYQGVLIKISDIPERLGLKDESKDYLFTIYRIKRTEEGFRILADPYVYNGSLELDDFHGKRNSLDVPFTNELKEGLLNFLGSL